MVTQLSDIVTKGFNMAYTKINLENLQHHWDYIQNGLFKDFGLSLFDIDGVEKSVYPICFQDDSEVKTEWRKVQDLDKNVTLSRLNDWVNKYLIEEQISKMNASVRKKMSRANGAKRKAVRSPAHVKWIWISLLKKNN